MRLRARFLAINILMIISFVAFLLLMRAFELDRSKALLFGEITQRHQFFNKLEDLDGRQLKTLASDYAFWDDMVSFVKTGDPTFAAQNLDTGLKTYGADGIWVYRLNRTLVYGATNTASDLTEPHLPPAAFEQLKQKHFMHFFVQTSSGPLEIRAATIHPGSDEERKTPPQGYLLAGRLWSASYLSQLGQLAQGTVKTIGPQDTVTTVDEKTGNVRFTEDLNDWEGKLIARVVVENKLAVADLNNLYNRQGILLVIFGVLSLGLIIFAISRWVLSPLTRITTSLQHDEPGMLTHLGRSNSEFGHLARTIMEFYYQKVNLAAAEGKRTQLEEITRIKSDFLAMAAHEMTTPAINIGMLAEMVAKGSDKSDAKTKSYLGRIVAQARKINIRISDLTDASKMENGEIQARKSAFNFDEFLHNVVDDMQITIEQPIKLEAATKASVNSDRDRLDQVVSNLIRNASKYSPKDSTITISAIQKGGNVEVQIKDQGIGISDEDRQKLFARFYRSDAVKEAKYSGLGLGLYICAQIIEALDGKIWVESELGKGSTFYFQIPI